MVSFVKRYMRWLHTQWPAGTVEKLPVVAEGGSTNVPGVYITGDLTGIPLLKFSADGGARAVHAMLNDPAFKNRDQSDDSVLDLAIIGGGVSGFSAAIEAKKAGLKFTLFEAAEPFSTIANFPKGKPIFTYPTDLTPSGDLQFHEKSSVKEGLLEDLYEQTLQAGIEPQFMRIDRIRRDGKTLELVPAKGDEIVRAHRVIVAIGRSGNFRKLGVPGQDLPKVYNRLHDPADFCEQNVTIVGGGDSAMETAIALATCGCNVTMSYRKPQFSRPKPENVDKINELAGNPAADVAIEEPTGDRVTTTSGRFQGEHRRPGSLRLMMASKPKEVREGEVEITNADGQVETLPNDAVFAMIGREPPLDCFRRSGIHIRSEWRSSTIIGLVVFLLFCTWLYHWKGDYNIPFGLKDTFNQYVGVDVSGIKKMADDPSSLLGTLAISMSGRSFYYTLAYATCVVVFGIRRVRRRKTPYIKLQTFTLAAIQVVPLFLLPEIVFPFLGHNGVFDTGAGQWFADQFFPAAGYGHGREYWRAYGFVLAWPLMAWNWFTEAPLWGWLIVGFLQTFVAIPAIIYFWGKGAYCGWICSCGALAETMGDTHRHKMPHGPRWNRLNFVGQVFLLFAVVIMICRIIGWVTPGEDGFDKAFKYLAKGDGLPLLNFAYMVDLIWAGILGVGLYFHFSGRVWCRFACPLAALMHIYARFSQFRILPEKKKCISCNVCTSVCHQGIDIMNFANKGLPMADPECVRCSACVQSCPTGVLSFGRINNATGEVIEKDTLPASPVQMAEITVNGRKLDDSGMNGKLWATAAVLTMLVCGAMWAATNAEGAATIKPVAATSQPAASQPATSQPAGTARRVAPTGKARAPDHGAFDTILKKTVRKQRVDYKAIRKDHMAELTAYLTAMAKVDHVNLKKNDRFAFYINVYNATVIRTVAQRYKAGYSVSENSFKLFSRKLVELNSGSVSPDHLEKKMTWDAFHDPRMHVAFVCAARSCPPILPRAYLGEDLDQVLNANMKKFVSNDPGRNQINVDGKRAKLSQLFDWYARDFGGKGNVESYVDKYHAAKIKGFKIEFLEYDWTLNDVD